MKIEVGKFYGDNEGRKVQIIYIHDYGKYPVVGITNQMNSKKSICAIMYSKDGVYKHNSNYNLISEWQEPLDFDWDCLPKWADRYIVMDNIGRWFCFDKRPFIEYSQWINYEWISQIEDSFYPKNFTGDWKDSLFKNPKYKD